MKLNICAKLQEAVLAVSQQNRLTTAASIRTTTQIKNLNYQTAADINYHKFIGKRTPSLLLVYNAARRHRRHCCQV